MSCSAVKVAANIGHISNRPTRTAHNEHFHFKPEFKTGAVKLRRGIYRKNAPQAVTFEVVLLDLELRISWMCCSCFEFLQKSCRSAKHGWETNVYWTVHHCNSWRMKDQLDVTCYFISLIMRSTCFGHQYIHLQELATVLMS